MVEMELYCALRLPARRPRRVNSVRLSGGRNWEPTWNAEAPGSAIANLGFVTDRHPCRYRRPRGSRGQPGAGRVSRAGDETVAGRPGLKCGGMVASGGLADLFAKKVPGPHALYAVPGARSGAYTGSGVVWWGVSISVGFGRSHSWAHGACRGSTRRRVRGSTTSNAKHSAPARLSCGLQTPFGRVEPV